jgi:hypothetical protein
VLIANSKGNYSFLRGIAPYSAGVIAAEGYEIVQVRFLQPVALSEGFSAVKEHLSAAGRPVHALCAMQLRSPQPFSFQGFADFNAGYIAALRDWTIVEGGVNPVARTNVAPQIDPPTSAALHGFSYTAQAAAGRRTFVVAGAGELPEGSLDAHDVVRRGETSADALREKVRFVMGLMSRRLTGLGVSWKDVTNVNVYTVHPICRVLAGDIIRPIGPAATHGVTWHYCRPPIVSIEYEMDMRGTDRELILSHL